jgi:predicted nucleic acid-binding protein
MYLLDIDILSNLMKRAPASALVARVARVPPEDQFTSSVTLGELLYGAHRSSRTAALLERIEETLLPELPILPFDAAAALRGAQGGARTEGHPHRRRRHARCVHRPVPGTDGGDRQRASLSEGVWARDRELAERLRAARPIQELLGHANISITLDTYSHVIPGMGNQTVDAMEEIFS